MRIFAHRGVSAEHPENTLPAFERARELGCDGIELDVRLSRDGIPAVIHDETVDRTTNGTGRIAEFTMRELRELDAGSGAQIPSLGQVLALAAGRLSVNVEIKDPSAVEAVLAELEEHALVDAFVSSEHESVLHHARRLSVDVDLYPLAERDGVDAALDLARDVGGTGVSIEHTGLTLAGVERAHADGLLVWAWTVNSPERARDLRDLGADALCTDDPRTIAEALRPGAPR